MSDSKEKTNIKYERFSNQSSSEELLLGNNRDKKSELHSNTDSKGNRVPTEHQIPTTSIQQHVQRSLSPASVADRCRIAFEGSGNTLTIVDHAKNRKYPFKRHEKQKNESNTDASGSKLKPLYADSNRDRVPTEHQKPTISSQQHIQRSLSPASVVDRCRIAIEGSGNTFTIVDHAKNRKYPFKRDEKQKNVPKTDASGSKLKPLCADSNRDRVPTEHQKPRTSSQQHVQRSLSPASVADRCRTAITGSGNTFSIEVHAESKRSRLKKHAKFQ